MWTPNAFMSNPLFMAGMQGMAAATNPKADVGAAWGQGMNSAMQYQQQQQQQQQQQKAWDWKVQDRARAQQRREALQAAVSAPEMQAQLGPLGGLAAAAPDVVLPEMVKAQFATPTSILGKVNPSDFTPSSLAAFNATVAAGAPNYNMLKRVIDPQSQLAAATAAFTLQQHKRDARLEKLRAEQTVRNHVYKAETFLRDLNAAQSKISPFTTGGAGKLASFVAGTPAYALKQDIITPVSYTHLRAHET